MIFELEYSHLKHLWAKLAFKFGLLQKPSTPSFLCFKDVNHFLCKQLRDMRYLCKIFVFAVCVCVWDRLSQ